jgi:hypothetical protein
LNQARLTCLIAFFGTFLVKKNVETKRCHKMKKFKRRIVAYETLDFFYLFTLFKLLSTKKKLIFFPDLTLRLNSHALLCIGQTVQASFAYDRAL